MTKLEVSSVDKKARREVLESKILNFCRNEEKSLGEIAQHLDMNKHTLRSVYLYPMVLGEKLVKTTTFPFKSTTKYRAF